MTSIELVEVFCFYGDESMYADFVPLVVGGLVFVSKTKISLIYTTAADKMNRRLNSAMVHMWLL